MSRIETVVVDFDNTLFDWVGMWHACYGALLDHLADEGVDPDDFKEETRHFQQHAGTSEYAHLLDDCWSTREWPRTKREQAARVWRNTKSQVTRLYPGVLETLSELKGEGCKIVVHTDSMVGYSRLRLGMLGLADVVDLLACPETHAESNHEDPVPLVELADPCEITHELPWYCHKPDPDLVSTVLDVAGARPETTLYVGDSLHRDVRPANQVGVTTAHAAYGRPDPAHLPLLRSVTHWTPEMIEQNKSVDVSAVEPDATIGGFNEILPLVRG